MILVDTSVWVDHLRHANTRLVKWLEQGEVLCHDFIIGELACGNLRNRSEILSLLKNLPYAESARNEEVLAFIDSQKLFGQGIGWVDVHLLASARLSGGGFWTLDKRLASLAAKMGISEV